MTKKTHQQSQSRSIEILGVKVSNLSKSEVLGQIDDFLSESEHDPIQPNQKSLSRYIVTPYSEFFIKACKDREFKNILNNSFISLPDGVFVQWASYFNNLLDKKLKKTDSKPNVFHRLRNFLTILFYFVVSGATVVIKPKVVKKVIKERIPGSTFVYDIVKLAAEKQYKIAILGGYNFGKGNTGILSAQIFKKAYPGLIITEIYPGDREKEEFGEKVIEILRSSKADILLCAYGPVRQEKWLAVNLSKTGIPLGIGLGGTLDYVSGAKKLPPKWIRRIGLEWFFRPFFAEGLNPGRFIKRLLRAWPAMLISSLLVLLANLKKYVLGSNKIDFD